MGIEVQKTTLIALGESYMTKNVKEVLQVNSLASGIVVTVFEPTTQLAGLIYLGLPDSKMAPPGDTRLEKYVDTGLPQFMQLLVQKGIPRVTVQIKLIGGSQLFNFGGGSGNVLNIGARNAITARTILSREGFQVDKADTGGNKSRSITLMVATGQVQVSHPGEPYRIL